MHRRHADMPPHTVRILASTVLAAGIALGAAGCNTTGNDITGAPASEADWRQSLEVWGQRYRKDPGDIQAAIAYARALRATDQRTQAVAVLEQANLRHP